MYILNENMLYSVKTVLILRTFFWNDVNILLTSIGSPRKSFLLLKMLFYSKENLLQTMVRFFLLKQQKTRLEPENKRVRFGKKWSNNQISNDDICLLFYFLIILYPKWFITAHKSVFALKGLHLALASSWVVYMGHLMNESFYSTSVPYGLTKMLMPNSALLEENG